MNKSANEFECGTFDITMLIIIGLLETKIKSETCVEDIYIK